MNKIEHPRLPNGISRIGLGCARLNAGADRKLGVQVIETAIALGVTHFDTAPSYGFGLSEKLLGDVIGNDKRFSVATKVGIAPPSGGGARSLARKLLKPIAKGLPFVKRAMIGALSATAAPRPSLSADSIRQYLDNSRASLRRDTIELYMLHEPTQAVLTDKDLFDSFNALRANGMVNAFGVGIGETFEQDPVFGDVAQSQWTTASHALDHQKLRLHHGIFRHNLPRLRQALTVPSKIQTLAQTLDFDIGDQDCHPTILLTAAMILRPRDVFLISSNSPIRITSSLKGLNWEKIVSPSEKDINASYRLLSALDFK